MCPKKKKKGQHADKLQHAANCLLAEGKKHSALFSSPPRGRCLIQSIKTEKSNYSCGTGEAQLQQGTALSPASGFSVAKPCHVPSGSARAGGVLQQRPGEPPCAEPGMWDGEQPRGRAALHRRTWGHRGEEMPEQRGHVWANFFNFFFLRVRGLDCIFKAPSCIVGHFISLWLRLWCSGVSRGWAGHGEQLVLGTGDLEGDPPPARCWPHVAGASGPPRAPGQGVSLAVPGMAPGAVPPSPREGRAGAGPSHTWFHLAPPARAPWERSAPLILSFRLQKPLLHS